MVVFVVHDAIMIKLPLLSVATYVVKYNLDTARSECPDTLRSNFDEWSAYTSVGSISIFARDWTRSVERCFDSLLLRIVLLLRRRGPHEWRSTFARGTSARLPFSTRPVVFDMKIVSRFQFQVVRCSGMYDQVEMATKRL